MESVASAFATVGYDQIMVDAIVDYLKLYQQVRNMIIANQDRCIPGDEQFNPTNCKLKPNAQKAFGILQQYSFPLYLDSLISGRVELEILNLFNEDLHYWEGVVFSAITNEAALNKGK